MTEERKIGRVRRFRQKPQQQPRAGASIIENEWDGFAFDVMQHMGMIAGPAPAVRHRSDRPDETEEVESPHEQVERNADDDAAQVLRDKTADMQAEIDALRAAVAELAARIPTFDSGAFEGLDADGKNSENDDVGLLVSEGDTDDETIIHFEGDDDDDNDSDGEFDLIEIEWDRSGSGKLEYRIRPLDVDEGSLIIGEMPDEWEVIDTAAGCG